MFVPNLSSSVGKLNPSAVHFIYCTCQNVFDCRHQLSINWRACARCSSQPALHARERCLTILDAIPGSYEVVLALRVTAMRPWSWLNLTLWDWNFEARWHQSVFVPLYLLLMHLLIWITWSQMWCGTGGETRLHFCCLCLVTFAVIRLSGTRDPFPSHIIKGVTPLALRRNQSLSRENINNDSFKSLLLTFCFSCP